MTKIMPFPTMPCPWKQASVSFIVVYGVGISVCVYVCVCVSVVGGIYLRKDYLPEASLEVNESHHVTLR